MLRKALGTAGFLIGTYVVLEHWYGFSESVKAAAGGTSTVVKTLQGRG